MTKKPFHFIGKVLPPVDPLLTTYDDQAPAGIPKSEAGLGEIRKLLAANTDFLLACGKVRTVFSIVPSELRNRDMAAKWVRRLRHDGRADDFGKQVSELMRRFYITKRWSMLIQHFILTDTIKDGLCPSAFEITMPRVEAENINLVLNKTTTLPDIIKFWPVIKNHLDALDPFDAKPTNGYGSFVYGLRRKGGVRHIAEPKPLYPIPTLERYKKVMRMKGQKTPEKIIAQEMGYHGPQELRIDIHKKKKLISEVRVY